MAQKEGGGGHMFMRVIHTGSRAGNSYALVADSGEILLLDAGCRYKDILKGTDYRVSDISGVLLTHEHQDHIKSFRDFMRAGVQCFGCDELAEYIETVYGEKIKGLAEKRQVQIGSFVITPFYLPHTTRDKDTGALIPCPNFGYLIQCGDEKLLYMTDWEYCSYIFKRQRINYMVLECNHMDNLMDSSSANYIHALKGHSSLSVVKDFVEVNKTPDLRNIILCHLSSENADPETMQKEVQSVAGKWVSVAVAKAGMELKMSKYPF